eukprot:jgi/Tetstr1/455419/TSEL_042251.t1
MGTDADEATTALIAAMLAEDQAAAYGVDQYGLYQDDSADSDYGGGGKRRKAAAPRKPKAAKEPKPRKPKAPAREDDADQEYSATGRRKRKDTGATRTKARAWTEEEERLFQEALVLHGRNWKACAGHGKRLPPKVAESGEGYTLSGKPLDPDSAAARAYGFKPDSMQKLQDEHDELPGLKAGAEGQDEPGDGAAQDLPAGGSGGDAPAPAAAPEAARAEKADKARDQPTSTRKTNRNKENIDVLQAPTEPTEYAKSRPKRQVAERAAFRGQLSESLELVALQEYRGPVASGSAGSQPFSVEIADAANLVMDFHAHLSTHEIIGLLGGTWDPATRAITILEAFPCRRACGSDSQTSVELDPEHEVETRALMEQRKLTPVGWYHSHPTFQPKPSSKDNSNQHNYQALFRDEKSGLEPFVGIIYGPYDLMLPDTASARTVFVVQQKSGVLMPYNVKFSTTAMALPDDNVASKLSALTAMFKDDIGRVDFTELWRPFATLDRGVPSGGPVTKLAKLRNALGAHLPPEDFQQAEELLDSMAVELQRVWNLDLGYTTA